MTLVRPNVRGSDCPSESPCPTPSPSPSPYSPTDFGYLHHLSHQRGASLAGAFEGTHPRDVMVSATRIDADLQTIEHLDFEPVVPCEAKIKGRLHDGPADVLIVGQCPGCVAVKFHLRRYGMCWRHWRKAESVELTCKACGHRDVMAGGFFRIVEVLR